MAKSKCAGRKKPVKFTSKKSGKAVSFCAEPRKKSRRKVGSRFTVKTKKGGKVCMVQTANGPRFAKNRTKSGACSRRAASSK